MYINTAEKVRVENYPYSFTLRTTLFDSMEFNAKKGYRHVTQTINPKTNRENNPKKSTYYPLLVRYRNEEGHIKSMAFDFNGRDELNRGVQFIAENFDLFSADEVQYLYSILFTMTAVDMKATVIYGGAKFDDLKPIYDPFIDTIKQGLTGGGNVLTGLRLDAEAIEKAKPEGYNPFRVR
jgi:hypothetical protein